MTRAVLSTLLLLLLAPSGTGCSYAASRAKDFTDIISIGASTGGGILLRARATRLVTAEVGAQYTEHFYGWRRRNWQWLESSYGLFFASVWSPRLENEPFMDWWWTDLFKTSHTRIKFLTLPSVEDWRHHVFILSHAETAHLLDLCDVEATASALVVGLQISVRPGELVDFLAGIFGLDLAGDDASPPSPPPAAEERAAASTEAPPSP